MADPIFPAWTPPFCADDAEDLACPKCGEETVLVREQATYFDGDAVEAYCSECHAMLEVQAAVTITFSDPEIVE